MTVATFRIDIYNDDGEKVGLIDQASLVAFSYELKINNIGSMAFTVSMSHSINSIINEHYVAHISRKNPFTAEWESEGGYILTKRETFVDENGNSYVGHGGVGLEWMLAGRIILPELGPVLIDSLLTGNKAIILNEGRIQVRDYDMRDYWRFCNSLPNLVRLISG
jgi:hypothetical protein